MKWEDNGLKSVSFRTGDYTILRFNSSIDRYETLHYDSGSCKFYMNPKSEGTVFLAEYEIDRIRSSLFRERINKTISIKTIKKLADEHTINVDVNELARRIETPGFNREFDVDKYINFDGAIYE